MSWLGTVVKGVLGALPIVGALVNRSSSPLRKLSQKRAQAAMADLKRRNDEARRAFVEAWNEEDRHGRN